MKSLRFSPALIVMLAFASASSPAAAAGFSVMVETEWEGDGAPDLGRSVGVDIGPVSTPYVPRTTVGTPYVGEGCAVVVCAGPIQPVPITTVGPVDSVPLTPPSGARVNWTEPEPRVGLTTFGPVRVTGEPVPITLCPTTCPLPYATVGGTVEVGVYVGDFRIGQPATLP